MDDSEVREALNECVAAIVSAIRVALERTPPELSADISDRGLVLAGGGALLRNLDKRIRDETGLPVCVADDHLCSVVLGTAATPTQWIDILPQNAEKWQIEKARHMDALDAAFPMREPMAGETVEQWIMRETKPLRNPIGGAASATTA